MVIEKLAIYTRLSADQKESTSIKNQIKQGKRFAKKNGFEPIIYNEGEGLSGKLPLHKRPQLNKMLLDFEGDIKNVWFRDQERLERHPSTLMTFVETVRDNEVTVYIDGKKIDMVDSNNVFNMIIQSASSFQFADKRTAMVKKAALINLEEGKAFGSAPFGYKTKKKSKKLVPHKTNSKLLLGFFNDYLSGKGTTLIAQELNRKNVPTLSKRTTKWTDSTILYMLKNKIYIGKRGYAKEVYENIEPLVDVDTFNRVQAKIQQNGNRGNKGYNWLLNGLVKCGVCGEPMNGRSYSYRKYFYYICVTQRYSEKRCGNRAIQMEALDDIVWDSLFNNVRLTDKVKKGYQEGFNTEQKEEISNNITEYKKYIKTVQAKIDLVPDMVENRILTR